MVTYILVGLRCFFLGSLVGGAIMAIMAASRDVEDDYYRGQNNYDEDGDEK